MKINALADSASFLLAQAAPAPGAGPGMIGTFLPLVLMMAAMYFFLIAPQRKKQKEHEKMLGALDSGDQVMLASGIFGEITNKKDDRFVVRIAEGVKVEVAKSFVQTVLSKGGSK
ncbi:preprotein translocase subunit YajC [Nibricoccus sp. IMCC34717]|uniref:preprotein translocase subunit YajC n=1 Tax=Nibricoccus sp. IMCC34717 TaxID=3034021 RepID=UPI00384F0AD9